MAAFASCQPQIESLRDKGYVVVPRFVPAEMLSRLNEVARAQLAARADPLEFEADLQYPGAPKSRTDDGGTSSGDQKDVNSPRRDPRTIRASKP